MFEYLTHTLYYTHNGDASTQDHRTYWQGRSKCPRGLRRGSATARLLRLWVRIPPGAWIFVYCECCVLSDRGLCEGPITRPEESYRLWCVVVCDLEISWMRRPWPTTELLRQTQTNKQNALARAGSALHCNLMFKCTKRISVTFLL